MLFKTRQLKDFVKLICCVDAVEVYFLQINLQITANETDNMLMNWNKISMHIFSLTSSVIFLETSCIHMFI